MPEAVARERVEGGRATTPVRRRVAQWPLELPALDRRTLVFDGTLAPSALVDEIVGTIASYERPGVVPAAIRDTLVVG